MQAPPARNELCPCGSGKRYKRCCGALIPISVAASVRPPAPSAAGLRDAARSWRDGRIDTAFVPDPSRNCGTCTACCDGWLTANIRGHEMRVGVPCHFRGEGGCTIYEDRPEDPCRGFHCAWRLSGNPFPESFRPDRLGVIILAKRWHDRVAYYLGPAGGELDASLLEWMRKHSEATGTPFLFVVNGRYRGFGSAEFQQDILDKTSRGEPALPGLNPSVAGPCKLTSLASDVSAAEGS
jgi:hypothetical protein